MRGILQRIMRKRAFNEAEYIERVRRWVAWNERWRFWFRLLAIVLLLCTIALIVVYVQTLNNLDNLFPGIRPGFAIGVIVGCKLGLLLVTVAHFLIIWFMVDVRKDKLLLRYHDALEDLRRLAELTGMNNESTSATRLAPPHTER